MRAWSAVGERRRLHALRGLFRDSERLQTRGVPIRVTGHGIWVPTPFSVLVDLLRSLKARDFFKGGDGERPRILDVGSGDGRVPAALAFFEPLVEVVGIESDERLCRQAASNLEALTRKMLLSKPDRVRLVQGDYREVVEGLDGIRWTDVRFVFNYPDGNERELERVVIERGAPGTHLCLLTHDRDLRLRELELAHREDVPVRGSGSTWRFSVYCR